jgi:regulator of sigma E protease
MLGGIIMNIILGIIIFTFTLSYYEKDYIDPKVVKDGIYAYDIGQDVGFRTGDQIVTVDGHTMSRDNDLTSGAMVFGANVKILRNGQEMTIKVPDTLFKRIQGAKDFYVAFHNFPFKVDSVLQYSDKNQTIISTASKIGLKKGDAIVSINDEPVKVYGDVKTLLMKHDSMPATIVVDRAGQLLTFHVDTIKNAVLGFMPTQPYPVEPYTLGRAIKFGAKDGFSAIYYNAIGLGRIFTGKLSARDSLQSPIGIAQVYGGVWIWAKFWFLTGLISFVLAFMNFLPIPALDGGHVMFIIVEVIQGKPVSEKFLENAQKVGIFILLGLMVFAFGNDILKIFKI